jgi:hypothetical protein
VNVGILIIETTLQRSDIFIATGIETAGSWRSGI